VAKPAVWTLAFKRKPEPKARRRISSMSVRRREEAKEYRMVVIRLKRKHPICEVPKCGAKSVDPHHTRGRAGPLYTDERYIKMVCRKCHDRIRDDVSWARSVGMLCQQGLWNTPDRS